MAIFRRGMRNPATNSPAKIELFGAIGTDFAWKTTYFHLSMRLRLRDANLNYLELPRATFS
jgi:hypothetical protein